MEDEENPMEDDSNHEMNDMLTDRIAVYYMSQIDQEFDPNIYTYAVDVPVSQHNLPEVKEAKEDEFQNLIDYNVFEEVKNEGQDFIDARWTIRRKEEHDGLKQGVKARIVAKGFQELHKPASDSPTAMRESFRLLMTVAAVENVEVLASIDIKAAFLNSVMEREIYVRPPKDLRKDDVLWLLKKHLYGTIDASRGFWKLMRKVFSSLGMIPLPGDEACYYLRQGEKLTACIITHVDDFLVASTRKFMDLLVTTLKSQMKISKIEEDKFRFTGIDVSRMDGDIVISMDAYANSLEDILEFRQGKKEEPLTKLESRMYRKYNGQISCCLLYTSPSPRDS